VFLIINSFGRCCFFPTMLLVDTAFTGEDA
jgi:hypothetical protein